MIQEFKQFIMRGNVIDLAVAVIIATAFGAVITSFTNDILMPPIGLILGDMDFSDLKVVLQAASVDSDGNVIAEEVAIRYGQWVKTVIDFLIIGFVLFMVIKAYNKTNAKKKEEEPSPSGPSEIDLLIEIRDALKK